MLDQQHTCIRVATVVKAGRWCVFKGLDLDPYVLGPILGHPQNLEQKNLSQTRYFTAGPAQRHR